ncbi:putative protein phosphatase 2C 46 [Morus notabilis]|uniref:protein-serine/threonine phosphatase n=1 Tax=Morus notabilis TaxID=981085 RepID=W9T0N3_9ROSA|nr:putative protein phosphatase 2C 46 [Morus notabilis]
MEVGFWILGHNGDVDRNLDIGCSKEAGPGEMRDVIKVDELSEGLLAAVLGQANNLLEDQSQIESGSLSLLDSGPYGTFVGVYDGHGGPETSRYINDHLFQHLKRFTSEQQSMSTDVIRKAYQATEEGFMSVVTKQWSMKPQLAAVGSCCLVGVICGGTLYVANLGDSRAVLGRLVKATGEVLAIQLSSEHNVGLESVRQEMYSLHPDDSQIVVLKHNVWRVKGLIQVSRSIGDVYLKKAEFNREPLYAKFRLREPFKKPILSSEPSITAHELQPHDQFVIFASDGLWEHLSNQEAVDIVQNHPRSLGGESLGLGASGSIRSEVCFPSSAIHFLSHLQTRGPRFTRSMWRGHFAWIGRAKSLTPWLYNFLMQNEMRQSFPMWMSHAPILHEGDLGSARRLVKVALQEAAKKREMRYSDLKKIDRGVRRHFHDDITVIVVFLDSNLVSRASSVRGLTLSLRGGGITLPAKTATTMELNTT